MFLEQNEKEFGSTPVEVICKNFVLKNLVKPTGKHLQWSSSFSNIEVSGWHLQCILKNFPEQLFCRTIDDWYFPESFSK